MGRSERQMAILERKAQTASAADREEHLAQIEVMRSKQLEAKQMITKLNKIEYKAGETIKVLMNWKLVTRASRMALKSSLAPFKKKLTELEDELSRTEQNTKEADGLQDQVEDLREKISMTTINANSKLAAEVNMLTQSQLAQTQLKAQRGASDIDALNGKLDVLREFAAKHRISVPDVQLPETFEEELKNFESKLGATSDPA